tara:strand:- start:99 stop:368 length:270 start_codon:yes stop_codon:yes gene_type:complete
MKLLSTDRLIKLIKKIDELIAKAVEKRLSKNAAQQVKNFEKAEKAQDLADKVVKQTKQWATDKNVEAIQKNIDLTEESFKLRNFMEKGN